MTDEERGGKEPRTADLKGNAPGCLFLLTSSPLFTHPLPPAACGGTNCVHR